MFSSLVFSHGVQSVPNKCVSTRRVNAFLFVRSPRSPSSSPRARGPRSAQGRGSLASAPFPLSSRRLLVGLLRKRDPTPAPRPSQVPPSFPLITGGIYHHMELTVRTPGFPSRLNPRGLGLSFSHTQHRAGSEVTELLAGWTAGWTEQRDSSWDMKRQLKEYRKLRVAS